MCRQPVAGQLVLTIGEKALAASLTDFQECYGQPKKKKKAIQACFFSLLPFKEADIMNGDMNLVIFGRRLMSSVLGTQCIN